MILHLLYEVLIAFSCSILFHELGHILYFKLKFDRVVYPRVIRRGRATVIQIGREEDYKGMTQEQKEKLYLWGVSFGAGFILVYILITNNIYWTFLLAPYFYACRTDLKRSRLLN